MSIIFSSTTNVQGFIKTSDWHFNLTKEFISSKLDPYDQFQQSAEATLKYDLFHLRSKKKSVEKQLVFQAWRTYASTANFVIGGSSWMLRCRYWEAERLHLDPTLNTFWKCWKKYIVHVFWNDPIKIEYFLDCFVVTNDILLKRLIFMTAKCISLTENRIFFLV